MRRIVNVLLLLCLPVVVLSTEVSQQQAKDKACAFMQQLQGRRAQALGHDVSRNMQLVEMGLQSLYAFNCEGGGYVIVSGDGRDAVEPPYMAGGLCRPDSQTATRRGKGGYTQSSCCPCQDRAARQSTMEPARTLQLGMSEGYGSRRCDVGLRLCGYGYVAGDVLP